MRAPRRGQAGMTLLEAILALAVFGTGVAALFGMITSVSDANRSMSFQNNSLDLFTRISAQVRDAQCDYDANALAFVFDPAMMDPGLTVLGGWQGAGGGVAGSVITAVGDDTNNPDLAEYVPKMRADYRVLDITPPAAPGAPPSPLLLMVEVRIRELMNDPAKDAPALESGPWIRNYPVQKLCAPRYDGLPRGAFF